MAQIFPYGMMPGSPLQMDQFDAPLPQSFLSPFDLERIRRLLPNVNAYRAAPVPGQFSPPQPEYYQPDVQFQQAALQYPENPALAPQPRAQQLPSPLPVQTSPVQQAMSMPADRAVPLPQPQGPRDFFDPRTQGLLALGMGLLAQSGWQPQRVGLGEAFGKAGMQAVNAMQQARASEDDRSLRALQRRKIESEIGSDDRQRRSFGVWQQLRANIKNADLTPYGGAPAPVTAPDGTVTAPPVDVKGRTPWDLLNAEADALEDQLKNPEVIAQMTPEVLKLARTEIKEMRDRADKIEGRDTKAPTTRTIPIGNISGKPHEQAQEWDAKAREWKNVGSPRPIFSDKPLVELNMPDPFAATTKKEQEDVRTHLRATESIITDMQRFLGDLRQTPGAVGAKGAIGQTVGGIAGQINPRAGEVVSEAITGAGPERIADIRTRAQLIRGRLLPVVTNETGRYTEAERKLATEAQAALDIAQSPMQVEAATKALLTISLMDKERDLAALGQEPSVDINTLDGYVAKAKEYESYGFSQKEAADLVDLLKNIRISRQRGR